MCGVHPIASENRNVRVKVTVKPHGFLLGSCPHHLVIDVESFHESPFKSKFGLIGADMIRRRPRGGERFGLTREYSARRLSFC